MARALIQHPETKKWRVFSTIVDEYVSDWMTEEEYYKWAIEDFINRLEPPVPSTWYTFEETEEFDSLQKRLKGEGRY